MKNFVDTQQLLIFQLFKLNFMPNLVDDDLNNYPKLLNAVLL